MGPTQSMVERRHEQSASQRDPKHANLSHFNLSFGRLGMSSRIWFSHWLIATAVLAVAECTGVAAVEIIFTAPAKAQFFDDQQYQYRRTQPRSGGFFQNFFGPDSRSYEDGYGPPRQQRQRSHTETPSDSSRAPPPRKMESKGGQNAPTTSIVVMGDDMADWLAYGLEEVFSDSPEIGIVRKNKLSSGLLHYDAKGDLDWWHVARDILANEKADFVVMMLGLSDRQNIREKDLAKEAEQKAKDEQAKDEVEKKNGQKSARADNTEKSVAPAPRQDKNTSRSFEFRSDEWAKIYSRRIDETIAALKSKGVPVFWVGLPSIRGARSMTDAAYLDDLYHKRAERAGIVYIDVWDGFVDEAGKYSNYGPDYKGQTRRLRSSDGAFFTKYGAIKLAHYVERELRRYMNNRATVALPSAPVKSVPSDERPLAGPVVPLTEIPKNSDGLLLGGAGGDSTDADAIATKVLVQGEALPPQPGRADDFVWPLGSDIKSTQPVAAVPASAVQSKALPPEAAGALASAPAEEKKKEDQKNRSAKTPTQKTATKRNRPAFRKPESPTNDMPRPPLPIRPSSGSFGSMY